jgi:hypothetical protein
MAATLTAQVNAGVSWTYTNALTGSINSVNSNSFSYSKSLTNGTGAAGTADLIYAAQTTIAGGATSNFDFVGGLTDFFGTTITGARLKFLYIHHTTDTAASSITVGAHAAPLTLLSVGTTTFSILNGGIYLFGSTGATVIAMTAATTDALKIVNADGAVTATLQICAILASA